MDEDEFDDEDDEDEDEEDDDDEDRRSDRDVDDDSDEEVRTYHFFYHVCMLTKIRMVPLSQRRRQQNANKAEHLRGCG